jgi:hypothetical protein
LEIFSANENSAAPKKLVADENIFDWPVTLRCNDPEVEVALAGGPLKILADRGDADATTADDATGNRLQDTGTIRIGADAPTDRSCEVYRLFLLVAPIGSTVPARGGATAIVG